MDMRVAAYAVIVDDDDRMLLAHWVQGRRSSWTLPGGGLEPGEDPEDAARREVAEETGYRVTIDRLIGVHSHVIPAHRRHTGNTPLQALRIVYTAHITGGDLRYEVGGSTDRAQWFTRAEIRDLPRVHLVDLAIRMREEAAR